MTRTFLILFALAALARPAAATQPPNILFIMTDEMRRDVMGCAGHPLVKTPHLDRLAQSGTRFERAFTVAPICVPSRYSQFTGRYAHVHGSTDNDTPPREKQVFLPSLLKHYGYETAISGKLHFIPNNMAYGFDYFWSYGGEGPRTLPTWPGFLEEKYGRASSRKLETQPFPDDPLGKDLGKLPYPKEDTQTFWITDRALEFLGKRNPDKPFFLFVSYLDPHSPSHLAEPYWSQARAIDPPLPASFRDDRPEGEKQTAANRHEVHDPAIVKALTAAYYAKVGMVDDNVGRLLERLEAAGLADNTIIIFTADHGNMTGDLNRWFKGCMYEGSSGIPLIIKAAPGSPQAAAFNSGKVVNEIVENIDIMPTLLEFIGHPLPRDPGIQGASLIPLVEGRAPAWDNTAFSERGSMMIRTAEWKLIKNPAKETRHGGTEYELYHLPADPLEMNNRIDDPACAEIRKNLQQRLDAWCADMPPVPVIDGVPPEPGSAPSEKPAKGKAGKEKPPKEKRATRET